MTITLTQALTLDHVHQDGPPFNSKGHCRIWRRNGATQTWKNHPYCFRMPVKYGLYEYGQVYAHSPVHAPEDCPHITPEERAAIRTTNAWAAQRDTISLELRYLANLGYITFNGPLMPTFDPSLPPYEYYYSDTRLPYRYTMQQVRGY